MTTYELWLELIVKNPRTQLFMLESKFPYELFKLIKTADLKTAIIIIIIQLLIIYGIL